MPISTCITEKKNTVNRVSMRLIPLIPFHSLSTNGPNKVDYKVWLNSARVYPGCQRYGSLLSALNLPYVLLWRFRFERVLPLVPRVARVSYFHLLKERSFPGFEFYAWVYLNFSPRLQDKFNQWFFYGVSFTGSKVKRFWYCRLWC